MKYSKAGTLYSLKPQGDDWIVVSFSNPLFGKEVGKGSEAAMKAFYELLTDGGMDAVGFEYNGVQVVIPKIETTGLLGGFRHSHVLTDEECFFGVDTAKGKDCIVYSRKSKTPSKTKPFCELGKAQKDFMARLGDL